MSEEKELEGYFVIKPEKISQLAGDTERLYYIVADILQESVVASETVEWLDSSTPILMEFYLALRDLKVLIEKTINEPDKEMLKLAKKHNIRDILIKGEDLLRLNQTLLETEALEKDLLVDYKITLNVQ